MAARLREATWSHFACHALAHPADPSQSYLALHGQPLKVSELFQMKFSQPYLAYLSACSTAAGSLRLLDENIHIASAFQLAGYPHVVATLWRIDDYVADDIAGDLYRAVHPDTGTWRGPAAALHDTVCTYRHTYLEQPQLWASHIHLGP